MIRFMYSFLVRRNPVWIKTFTDSKPLRGVEMMENLNFSISARTRSSRVASLTRLVLNKVVFVFDMDSKAVEIYSLENSRKCHINLFQFDQAKCFGFPFISPEI